MAASHWLFASTCLSCYTTSLPRASSVLRVFPLESNRRLKQKTVRHRKAHWRRSPRSRAAILIVQVLGVGQAMAAGEDAVTVEEAEAEAEADHGETLTGIAQPQSKSEKQIHFSRPPAAALAGLPGPHLPLCRRA